MSTETSKFEEGDGESGHDQQLGQFLESPERETSAPFPRILEIKKRSGVIEGRKPNGPVEFITQPGEPREPHTSHLVGKRLFFLNSEKTREENHENSSPRFFESCTGVG
jgi:hypothetical protein